MGLEWENKTIIILFIKGKYTHLKWILASTSLAWLCVAKNSSHVYNYMPILECLHQDYNQYVLGEGSQLISMGHSLLSVKKKKCQGQNVMTTGLVGSSCYICYVCQRSDAGMLSKSYLNV